MFLAHVSSEPATGYPHTGQAPLEKYSGIFLVQCRQVASEFATGNSSGMKLPLRISLGAHGPILVDTLREALPQLLPYSSPGLPATTSSLLLFVSFLVSGP